MGISFFFAFCRYPPQSLFQHPDLQNQGREEGGHQQSPRFLLLYQFR